MLRGKVSISWLLSAVRIVYLYEEPDIIRLKIFGVTLKKIPIKKTDDSTDGTAGSTAESRENPPKAKPATSSSQKKGNIKYTFQRICDKIRNVTDNIRYYHELFMEQETGLLFETYMKKAGKIITLLRPGRIRGELIAGTGQPDTTGYLYGVFCMLSPKLGNALIVTPDFEKKRIEGQLTVLGHIMLIRLLIKVVYMATDKKLKAFIKKCKRT